MPLGQSPETVEQLGVGAQGGLDALPRLRGVGAARQAHQCAARIGQSLQPFHAEEPPQKAGHAGEQHGADLTGGLRQRHRGLQDVVLEEFVQGEVAGVHLGAAGIVQRPVHRSVGGPQSI